MTSACVLTLCGLPAAGKTTFATSFMDYLKQADTPPTKESSEIHCSGSLSYRVIHIDYDELIPSDVEICVTEDNEQLVVIMLKTSVVFRSDY